MGVVVESIDESRGGPAPGLEPPAGAKTAAKTAGSNGLHVRAVATVAELHARRRRVQSLLPGRRHRAPQSRVSRAIREPVVPRLADGESRWIDIDGPVHYVDYGGPKGAPTMVMVHGLMAAHLNWLALAPELTDEYRVIALDLVGHGRTPGMGRRTDVWAHQEVLGRFLAEVVGGPSVLVGSSMGGLISILQATQEPQSVRGLVLVAPALPVNPVELPSPAVLLNYLPVAVPWLGTALLAMRHRTSSAEELVRASLEIVTADPGGLSEDLILEHIELAKVRLSLSGTSAGYQAAAQSTILTVLLARDYAARIRAVEAPVLLVQGDADKIISPTGARKIATENPHWDFESLPGVGHAPMMEVPERLGGSIRAWAETRLA